MKNFNVTVNGTAYNVSVEETVGGAAPAAHIAPPPAPVAAAPAPVAPVAPVAPSAPASAGAITISSPMPGNILEVKVAVGAAVKAGDTLCILEAMKMENEIVAPQNGTVASVSCAKGDVVNVGDVLISLN